MSYLNSLTQNEIAQFTEMGFGSEIIQKAFEKYQKERRSVINILLENSELFFKLNVFISLFNF